MGWVKPCGASQPHPQVGPLLTAQGLPAAPWLRVASAQHTRLIPVPSVADPTANMWPEPWPGWSGAASELSSTAALRVKGDSPQGSPLDALLRLGSSTPYPGPRGTLALHCPPPRRLLPAQGSHPHTLPRTEGATRISCPQPRLDPAL